MSTALVFPKTVDGFQIHSAYFNNRQTLSLMREILRGIDHKVLETRGLTEGTAWP